MESPREPQTLQEAIVFFAVPENCLNYLVARRPEWNDGVVCPICGSTKVGFLKNQLRWQCSNRHDKRQFSVKVGTIMEDSPIGLDKWLAETWMILNCKNGISSCEIARALGVTQKTAWFLLHRIRLAQQGKRGGKLGGEVEVDETFIGGKSRNMHKSKRARVITGTGGKDKTIVMGMMERGGEVRAMVVGDRRRKQLQSNIREHVEAGAAIFSDELKSYKGLETDYQHAIINHAVEYVNGNVHPIGMDVAIYILNRVVDDRVLVVGFQPFVRFQFVTEDCRASFDVLTDVALELLPAPVANHHCANFTAALHHSHNDGLVFAASAGDNASTLALVHVAGLASDEGFVYFNLPAQFSAALALLRESDPVQEEPCGFLSHAERPCDFTTADAVLAVQNHPGCGKPLIQTNGGILHDGSDLHGKLALVMSIAALPPQLILEETDLGATADRAHNAVIPFRPPRHKVVQAVLGNSKEDDCFLEGLGFAWAFHTSIMPQNRVLVKYIFASICVDGSQG